MNTVTVATLFVSKRVSALAVEATEEMLYWDGFRAYAEGQRLEDMPTKSQEQGWWAGNSAEAHSQVPFAFKVKEVDELAGEYEDWQEDVEVNRRGGWQ